MKRIAWSFSSEFLAPAGLSLLATAATTLILILIGRQVLGETVIALLYILVIGWITGTWGQGPGILAALVSALCFDFFFIPPYFTFAVGELEGWLVLAIFLAVAILIVGRIQSGLSRAEASERDAIFMYELSAELAGLRTRKELADTLARHLRRALGAELVEVALQPSAGAPMVHARTPSGRAVSDKPDLRLPIMGIPTPGLTGEIHIWRGNGWLPPEDGRLLRNVSTQVAVALARL